MNDLTLLSEGQIWGNNNESQLDVMKKYGTKAAITDLCILTGSYLCENTGYNIDEDRSLTGRTSWFWTKSDVGNNAIYAVDTDGIRNIAHGYLRNGVVRPALQSSVIFSQISPNRVRGYNDTFEVECGEYPQYAVDLVMQNILETEYNRGMNKTGKSYTFDSVKYDNYDTEFKAVTYEEYEYQGKKYIRIRANSDFWGDRFKLSNGVKYRNDDYVWVEVSPVKWLIDDRTGTLISKKGLVSGIRFLDRNQNYKGDFERTEMKEYLDRYMSKDLFQFAYKINATDNQKIIEIKKTIAEIKSYLNGLNKDLKEQINSHIDTMIENYNKKMESIKENSNPFNLTLETEDTIYINLSTELLLLAEKLSKFYKLYSLLNNYTDILYKKELSNNLDSLGQDLKSIIDVVIPFINDDSYKTKIVLIINKYKNKLEEAFRNDKYISFTKEKLIIDIRKDLHEILIDMANMVHTKSYSNAYNHILNSTESSRLESDNNIIILCLNRIYSSSDNIKSITVNELYLNRLNEILDFDIDSVKDINEKINILTNVLKKLYVLEYDIEFNNKKEEKFSNCLIR